MLFEIWIVIHKGLRSKHDLRSQLEFYGDSVGDIFKCIFLNENFAVLNTTELTATFVYMTGWSPARGDKPLPQPKYLPQGVTFSQ